MVKTLLNSSRKTLALSWALVNNWAPTLRAGIPKLSCRRDFMYRQKGLALPPLRSPKTHSVINLTLALVIARLFDFCTSLNCFHRARPPVRFAFSYRRCFFLDFRLSSCVIQELLCLPDEILTGAWDVKESLIQHLILFQLSFKEKSLYVLRKFSVNEVTFSFIFDHLAWDHTISLVSSYYRPVWCHCLQQWLCRGLKYWAPLWWSWREWAGF